MDVKVIGPIKEYLKMFNGPDEFNLWYAKNKDDIDKLTTHKLNKMYHIDGYRITKIKGVLCLKKDMKKHENEIETDMQNDLDLRDPQGKARSEQSSSGLKDRSQNESIIEDIQNEIEKLKLDIITIKTTINDIVKAINGE